MSANRLDVLKGLLAQNASDPFARYGLALEYLNGGDPEQAAAEFDILLNTNPDYLPAYFHAGRTLEKLGRPEEARQRYEQGIDVATRQRDTHTRSELQAALDLLI